MRGKKGQALIVVLVFIAVFVGIIATVVLISVVTYKKANYSHNKLIAQELAETGIQDALYKLNYEYHDTNHIYGFCSGPENILTPVSPNPGSCLLKTMSDNNDTDTTETYTIPATLLNIPGASSSDGVTVSLNIYNDNKTYDTLTAVGTYKGNQVTISTDIRTISNYFPGAPATGNLTLSLSDGTNQDTKGIPEAFNKHVIYATTVSPASPATIIIGNVYTRTSPPVTLPTDETWTETTTVTNPPLSVPTLAPSSTPVSLISLMPVPGSLPYIFQDGNENGNPIPPGFGVTYTATYTGKGKGKGNLKTETYIINGANISSERWLFKTANGAPTSDVLTVEIEGNTTMSSGGAVIVGNPGDLQEEDLIFEGSITHPLPGQFVAQNDITIDSSSCPYIGTPGEVTLWAGGNQGGATNQINMNYTTGSTPVIYGDVVGVNGFNFTPATNPITIYGAIISGTSLDLPSSLNLTLDLNTSPLDTQPAAILINDPSGSATLDIESTPTITLGPNQIATVMNYSSVPTITINENLNTDTMFQPGVIAYATNSANNATITIGNTNPATNINGFIYAGTAPGGTGLGSITLDSGAGTVKGCLVTNGTVYLNGGTVTWDPDPYKMYSNDEVYTGFVGGQRVFVPYNWKITW